jgi:Cu2+-exporting ATPase
MVDEVQHTLGGGVEGRISGHRIVIGSPQFVRQRVNASTEGLCGIEMQLAEAGLTPVLIGVDERVVAAAGLGDPIRDDARVSIDALRHAGWHVRILSGDHPEIVRAIGSALALPETDCMGGKSPEEKLAIVREAVAARESADNSVGSVVMVGDGVNDAAALAAAHVGIAVHGGAEASLAAADIYLNRPGLSAIVDLVHGSRRTMTVIRRNLAASLFYNTVAAALAMSGIINPLIAAILMPLSSLTVVTVSFRSRTFADKGVA